MWNINYIVVNDINSWWFINLTGNRSTWCVREFIWEILNGGSLMSRNSISLFSQTFYFGTKKMLKRFVSVSLDKLHKIRTLKKTRLVNCMDFRIMCAVFQYSKSLHTTYLFKTINLYSLNRLISHLLIQWNSFLWVSKSGWEI